VADFGHVLGNAGAGALFLAAVFRSSGPGVGLALALGSGALGNAANAWLRASAHSTIGASTAVFGALGIAVGQRIARRRGATSRRQAVWIPITAGLALLAMLGTQGERVDFWAHAFGLAAGIPLGLAAALLPSSWLARAPLQLAAGAGALLLLAAAWVAALES
jgi:membrane associated rhomboid family serine protease